MANEFVARKGIIVKGSVSLTHILVSGSYTVADNDYLIECDGDFSVTLPPASSSKDRILNFKNSGTGVINIIPDGSDLIDDKSSIDIIQFGYVSLHSNGFVWLNTGVSVIPTLQEVLISGSTLPLDNIINNDSQSLTIHNTDTNVVFDNNGFYINDVSTSNNMFRVESGGYVRIVNKDTNQELFSFDTGGRFANRNSDGYEKLVSEEEGGFKVNSINSSGVYIPRLEINYGDDYGVFDILNSQIHLGSDPTEYSSGGAKVLVYNASNGYVQMLSNGVVFQINDQTPDGDGFIGLGLEEITNYNNQTSNDIYIHSLYLEDNAVGGYGHIRIDDDRFIVNTVNGVVNLIFEIRGGTFSLVSDNANPNIALYVPNVDSTVSPKFITTSVNGIYPGATGNINLGAYLTASSLVNYYTKLETANFFGGTSSIVGYNKSNWDSIYATWSGYTPTTLPYVPISGTAGKVAFTNASGILGVHDSSFLYDQSLGRLTVGGNGLSLIVNGSATIARSLTTGDGYTQTIDGSLISIGSVAGSSGLTKILHMGTAVSNTSSYISFHGTNVSNGYVTYLQSASSNVYNSAGVFAYIFNNKITISAGTWNGDVIGSSYGGAGTVNGILKANGSGVVSAAVAGTDYLTPTGASASYQPLDADLTAIAALTTTGWLQRTGTNTWSLGTPTLQQTLVSNNTVVNYSPESYMNFHDGSSISDIPHFSVMKRSSDFSDLSESSSVVLRWSNGNSNELVIGQGHYGFKFIEDGTVSSMVMLYPVDEFTGTGNNITTTIATREWVALNSFYFNNGTLTSNRTVSGNQYALGFNNLDGFSVESTSHSFQVISNGNNFDGLYIGSNGSGYIQVNDESNSYQKLSWGGYGGQFKYRYYDSEKLILDDQFTLRNTTSGNDVVNFSNNGTFYFYYDNGSVSNNFFRADPYLRYSNPITGVDIMELDTNGSFNLNATNDSADYTNSHFSKQSMSTFEWSTANGSFDGQVLRFVADAGSYIIAQTVYNSRFVIDTTYSWEQQGLFISNENPGDSDYRNWRLSSDSNGYLHFDASTPDGIDYNNLLYAERDGYNVTFVSMSRNTYTIFEAYDSTLSLGNSLLELEVGASNAIINGGFQVTGYSQFGTGLVSRGTVSIEDRIDYITSSIPLIIFAINPSEEYNKWSYRTSTPEDGGGNAEYVIDLQHASGTMAYLSDLNSKQDTLVSGSNIKTINTRSILGSGNISTEFPYLNFGSPAQYQTVNSDYLTYEIAGINAPTSITFPAASTVIGKMFYVICRVDNAGYGKNLYSSGGNFIYKGTTLSSISMLQYQYFSVFSNGNDYLVTDMGSENIQKLWSTTHPQNYYISNAWDGTYWQITSNHSSPVAVGYAANANWANGYTTYDARYLTISGGSSAYYTKTQISNFFGGTSSIYGYNKTSWDNVSSTWGSQDPSNFVQKWEDWNSDFNAYGNITQYYNGDSYLHFKASSFNWKIGDYDNIQGMAYGYLNISERYTYLQNGRVSLGDENNAYYGQWIEINNDPDGSNGYGFIDLHGGNIFIDGQNIATQNWVDGSYAQSGGGNAYGTWNIDINGNASSASISSRLQTNNYAGTLYNLNTAVQSGTLVTGYNFTASISGTGTWHFVNIYRNESNNDVVVQHADAAYDTSQNRQGRRYSTNGGSSWSAWQKYVFHDQLGSNAYLSTAYLPLTGGILTGGLTGTSASFSGNISGTWNGNVISSSKGGAGSVNGILKANGSGTVAALSIGGGLYYDGTTLSSTVDSFYTTDGALSSSRYVEMNGNVITFQNSGDPRFTFYPNGNFYVNSENTNAAMFRIDPYLRYSNPYDGTDVLQIDVDGSFLLRWADSSGSSDDHFVKSAQGDFNWRTWDGSHSQIERFYATSGEETTEQIIRRSRLVIESNKDYDYSYQGFWLRNTSPSVNSTERLWQIMADDGGTFNLVAWDDIANNSFAAIEIGRVDQYISFIALNTVSGTGFYANDTVIQLANGVLSVEYSGYIYGNNWNINGSGDSKFNSVKANDGSNGVYYFGDSGKLIYTGVSTGDTSLKFRYNGVNDAIILAANNYNSYAPTLTGTGASGTWGISITGNAGSVGGLTVPKFFNNMGYNHEQFNNFSDLTSGGNYYIHQDSSITDGPGESAGYYANFVGLGNQYPVTGTGSYGLQTAIRRIFTSDSPYFWVRYKENNTYLSWRKIAAGFADNATQWNGIENYLVGGAQGPDGSMLPVGIRGDGLVLKYTAAAFQSMLGLGSMAYASTGSFVDVGSTDQTISVPKRFITNKGSTVSLTSTSTTEPALQAYNTDTGAAFMSFHRAGLYAINMGLDPDGNFKIGGWSYNGALLTLNPSTGLLTSAGGLFSNGIIHASSIGNDNYLGIDPTITGYINIQGSAYSGGYRDIRLNYSGGSVSTNILNATSGLSVGGTLAINSNQIYMVGGTSTLYFQYGGGDVNIATGGGQTTVGGNMFVTGGFYHQSNLNVLNKAATNWINWAQRSTAESETTINLSRIGYISLPALGYTDFIKLYAGGSNTSGLGVETSVYFPQGDNPSYVAYRAWVNEQGGQNYAKVGGLATGNINTNYGSVHGSQGMYLYNATDAATNTPESNWAHIIEMQHDNSNGWTGQIALSYFSNGGLFWRQQNNTTWRGWNEAASTSWVGDNYVQKWETWDSDFSTSGNMYGNDWYINSDGSFGFSGDSLTFNSGVLSSTSGDPWSINVGSGAASFMTVYAVAGVSVGSNADGYNGTIFFYNTGTSYYTSLSQFADEVEAGGTNNALLLPGESGTLATREWISNNYVQKWENWDNDLYVVGSITSQYDLYVYGDIYKYDGANDTFWRTYGSDGEISFAYNGTWWNTLTRDGITYNNSASKTLTLSWGNIASTNKTLYYPNENGTLATREWMSATSSSGIHYPTVLGSSGMSSYSVYRQTYNKTGNVVTVSGIMDITASTTNGCVIQLTIPITGNIYNFYDLAGSGSFQQPYTETLNSGVQIYGSGTFSEFSWTSKAGIGSTRSIAYMYQYYLT